MIRTQKLFLAGAAAAAIAGVTFFSAPQSNAATSNLTIEAEIVEAINLSCGTALDFGSLNSGEPGVVTVDANGNRTGTVASNLILGGGEKAGGCAINGEADRMVDLHIPDATLRHESIRSEVLEVRQFTVGGADVDAAGDGNNFSVTLQSRPENLTVGGQLVIEGGEEAGVYSGTVVVTATYQ